MDVIKLEGVVREYLMAEQPLYALAGINLTISKNEYISIMGPSGSGKSTLMNILGCLDSPTKGRYLLNGVDVSNMDDDELASIRNREIGFIFQSFNLLPRATAIENITLPMIYYGMRSAQRESRAYELLDLVGLSNRANHRPNQLSGGQRQRVAIARALACSPSIILADEPTGNLDSKSSEEIMALLGDIHSKGNTVIVVTHSEEIASYTQRTIRMRDGLIESVGD